MKYGIISELSLPIYNTIFTESYDGKVWLTDPFIEKYKNMLEELDIEDKEIFTRSRLISWMNHELLDLAYEELKLQIGELISSNTLEARLINKIKLGIISESEYLNVQNKVYQYSSFHYLEDHSTLERDIMEELELISSGTTKDIIEIFSNRFHNLLKHIISETERGISMKEEYILFSKFNTFNNQISSTIAISLNSKPQKQLTDNEKVYMFYAKVLHLFQCSYCDYITAKDKLLISEKIILINKLIHLEKNYNLFKKDDVVFTLSLSMYLDYILGTLMGYGFISRHAPYINKKNSELDGATVIDSKTVVRLT